MSVPPTPATLTLLLKSHKSTTLLSVLPTTPIATLKVDLLTLLQEHAEHLDLEIPDVPEEIELGMMIDPAGKDMSRGWHLVKPDSKTADVASMGIMDWGVVAWRIKGGGRFTVDVPREAGEDEEDEE